MTLLAYRFALDPTPRQERALRSHAGAARVAFNWGLARVKANVDQREAERSYGIAEADLTPSVEWSLYSLRKAWNEAKEQVAPWWRECSKEAFNTGLDQLARALKNWSASRRGKRKGRPVGFPRFRSKRKARPSVRFTTGAIRCEPTHAVLPRLGRVKLHERADLGQARVLSATVRYERGRWFVAYTVEQDLSRPAPVRPDVAAGVDLGKVADQRRDAIHKLTTALAAEYGTVVVEDLHVAGMVTNRRLARHITDAGFGEIRRQLEYKTAWHGGTLIVADRWFASSKTCAECGAVRAKLALSERQWTCTACGTVLDRDINAAVNLVRLAASGADSNGRGADQKTRPGGQVAVKRQPGTATAGQTGTLPPQGESAA